MSQVVLLRPGYSTVGFVPNLIPELLQSTDSSPLSPDESLMHVAILQAMQALSRARPNPGVGCAVQLGEAVVAFGATEKYRLRHAERVAFDSLGGEFPKESTVATTLEPCAKHGNQPPCLELFREGIVDRVLVGFIDPDTRTRGKSVRALMTQGTEVRVGVLGKECAAMQLPFIVAMGRKEPFIALKWAETKDRHLFHPDHRDTRLRITGPRTDIFSHRLRQRYDAIVIGANTWIQDRPSLTARHALLPDLRQPLRVIIDPKNLLSHLPDLPERFSDLSPPWILLGGERSPPGRLPPGVHYSTLPGNLDSDSVIHAIQEAAKTLGQSIQSVLIEGGPGLLGIFLKSHLFDVVHRLRSKAAQVGRLNPDFLEINRSVRLSSMDLGDDLLDEFISPELWLKVEELQSIAQPLG